MSLKHLVKSAAKGRGGHAGPDHGHASSELFLTGLRGHSDAVLGLAFSADGTALCTACDDRVVRLYDLSNLEAKIASSKGVPFKHKELLKVRVCGIGWLCVLWWGERGASVAFSAL